MRAKGVKYFDTGAIPAYIGFTSNEKAFMQEGRRLIKGDDLGSWAMASEAYPGRTQTLWKADEGNVTCIVTVHRPSMLKAKVAEAFGLFAHEAVHVMQAVEDYMGAPLGKEMQAYFVQTYTQYFFKAFSEGY